MLFPLDVQLFRFFPLQVQYVLTEKFLEPKIVCGHFHLCNQLLSRVMPRKDVFEHVLNQKQFSSEYNHEAKSIGMSSKLLRGVDKTLSSVSRLKASEVISTSRKQHSGQITFVQISDIHLDHDYAEVHTMYMNTNNLLTLRY